MNMELGTQLIDRMELVKLLGECVKQRDELQHSLDIANKAAFAAIAKSERLEAKVAQTELALREARDTFETIRQTIAFGGVAKIDEVLK